MAPRTAAETLSELEKQVQAACLGVAKTVNDLQTGQGVKDAYTQHWIKEFLQRSKDFQKEYPNAPLSQIQGILMGWVSSNKYLVYNNYLLLDGKFDVFLTYVYKLMHNSQRLGYIPRYPNRAVTHSFTWHCQVCVVHDAYGTKCQ